MRRLGFRKNVFLSEFGFYDSFRIRFDNSSRISEGCKAFSIQMVETILHVGLEELFLKEIKKIYGVVTKSAK